MKLLPFFILIACINFITIGSVAQGAPAKQPRTVLMDAGGNYPATGSIEMNDPALDKVIAKGAKVEMLAEGFVWCEGPVWVSAIGCLLFSDVPSNAIYSWNEKEGIKLWLKPSGYSGEGYYSREPGSNGLLLDKKGYLVMCQHGNRQMARMLPPVTDPASRFEIIANRYNGKKLNSPNDAVFDGKGNLYFTDPPYGLPRQMQDSSKEIPFQGVYMVKGDTSAILLIDSLTRPNGIAFFPGHKSLLVANTDPTRAIWYRYDVHGDALANGRIFFDATTKDRSLAGLPDGLKIDSKGNVFATGSGGIYIFNSSGNKIGMIRLEQVSTNVALSPDEKTLYITNSKNLLRLKMRK